MCTDRTKQACQGIIISTAFILIKALLQSTGPVKNLRAIIMQRNYLCNVNWTELSHIISPLKVLLLCRSWGACVPSRSQRLCQLEFLLLVGTTMLDRLWARGQTKCNTPLMLATSVFGRIHRRPCYVMAQPKSRLDIPWPNDAEYMGHVWYHFLCWHPLLFDVESLAGCVGG